MYGTVEYRAPRLKGGSYQGFPRIVFFVSTHSYVAIAAHVYIALEPPCLVTCV